MSDDDEDHEYFCIRIVDEDGYPVVGVRVSVHFAALMADSAEEFTNESGWACCLPIDTTVTWAGIVEAVYVNGRQVNNGTFTVEHEDSWSFVY